MITLSSRMETTRDPLEHFAYELLRAAELDALPEDAKAQLVVQLRDQAQRRVGIIAMQHLDAAGLEAFQTLIATQPPPDPQAVQAFFALRIPDFDTKAQEGILVFADEFIAAARERKATTPNA